MQINHHQRGVNRNERNNSVLLDKYWSSNGIENSVYYRSNNVISKYAYGFEYRSNADEI